MPLGEPEKLYYSIGEVSRMTELPASVLRFWESEFEYLRPPKNPGGKRTYRRADIDRILRIKKLLYEERFTIEGARKLLKEERVSRDLAAAKRGMSADEMRRGLQEILKILSK
ncbi:MAG TPA: MerR family transcriptional regulator [bacterium]|jgi:DNA-binding transcriptional MerR regulator